MLKPETEITYLPGVGPKKSKILNREISVYTVKDLLYHFPFKYTDKSKFYKVADIKTDAAYVQIVGKFCCFSQEGQKHKKYLHAEFFDETGGIDVVWFKGLNWIKKNIDTKKEYVIYGKPNKFRNSFSIAHPEIEELSNYKKSIKTPFRAEYSTTEKMKKAYLNSKQIAKLIKNSFEKKIKLNEFLPKNILEEFKLPEINQAILNIHFPQSIEKLESSRKRFKFEELFINQISLIKQKKFRTKSSESFIFEKVGTNFMSFYENKLNFELTNAQKKVLKEIRADFKTGKQCNRLLQGDVGSGKTIVALMSILIALDNNFQACIMAPTEILSTQHYNTISTMLKGMNINVKLLTGSTKLKERKIIDSELKSGELQILIGTHALIEDNVSFKNLGLAIIDEQHRFGVAQRGTLQKKNKFPPHIIVMSATPIPRTLSMTLYGDLDVSVIDQMPPGRKPVKTIHLYEKQRGKLYKFMKSEIKKGRQIYIVFPLIKESESLDYKNLEEGYQTLKQHFKTPEYEISIVHGQMKSVEKNEEMEKFINKKSQILIATTVIEVGVDIPNASVMIIESAERFGLSQLHQLRGRVGRGAEQSYCVLMTGHKLTTDSKKRIGTMVQTNNGFEIAEVDMRLRGPGDIFGKQQSGIPLKFKIANLLTDVKILSSARRKAIETLDNDPFLEQKENLKLAQKVKKEISESWGNVS